MSAVVLVRGEDGKLKGLGERGERAYSRFRSAVESLEVGETIQFEYRKPRSPRFHRMFFGMLADLFDRQERFEDIEQLRAWLIVGAGYCDFVPGLDGKIVAIPLSIAFASMDDNEFRELVVAVWQFVRSERAQRFLWPHLEPHVTHESVEQLLVGWDA